MAALEADKEGNSVTNSEASLASEASESGFDVPWASHVTTEECKCQCCGLLEEFTAAYIQQVRGSHCGQFVCGLCAEAVDEELTRKERNMSIEDALKSHMTICAQFNSPERADRTSQVLTEVVSMKKMFLRRMISSPYASKSKASARTLSRSSSSPG
ncbi:hypothetical protein O6H91_01G069000 [Diphasiastrum complanatum]|uniref:Uncharacterized protein n=1 Tax=Diphasiastrum complanatum TaxID=34168 RepID=A0ACC2ESC0_DIPCM|nr:hypothetical protein O6H91_01G069000 [Diphasiastrum complanatum]